MKGRTFAGRIGLFTLAVGIMLYWHIWARLVWCDMYATISDAGLEETRTIWNYQTNVSGFFTSHLLGLFHGFMALAIFCIVALILIGVVRLLISAFAPNPKLAAEATEHEAAGHEAAPIRRTSIQWGTKDEFEARAQEWRDREQQP